MILILGDKNLSTWSWRAWLSMESFNITREEIVIPLDQVDTKESILKYSPSGRVPCLIDDGTTTWDSLAICEYLAEKFPEKKMWPASTSARAEARSVCAEMHSGFQSLRKHLPGNIRLRKRIADLTPVMEDISRVEGIWQRCLSKHGGPFLFGEWSIADCFFAPVALRFQSYGVEVSTNASDYMDAVLNHPPVLKLQQQAAAEPLKSET